MFTCFREETGMQSRQVRKVAALLNVVSVFVERRKMLNVSSTLQFQCYENSVSSILQLTILIFLELIGSI